MLSIDLLYSEYIMGDGGHHTPAKGNGGSPNRPGSTGGGAKAVNNDRAGPKHRTHPSKYSGEIPFEDYLNQFEIVAELNGWSDVEMALQLQANLQGAATSAVAVLERHQRNDYEAVVKAIKSRYGTAEQQELHRTLLRTRQRKRDESLPDLAYDILRLARLAHPTAPKDTQESIAVEQFLESLTDRELRLRLQPERFATLSDALQAATRLEGIFSADRHRYGYKKVAFIAEDGLGEEEYQEDDVVYNVGGQHRPPFNQRK